jgi:signal peptidase II
MSRKPALFWPLALALVLTDCTTKRLAVEHLTPPHVPHDVVGDWVRLTLAYNPGAAFSLHLGQYSRWIFTALTLGILALLWQLYRQAPARDATRVVALALVCGGAVGNLIDRLRSPRGVVDFIDLGVGATRFWTFNVADVGVSVGAALLAAVLWREEERRAAGAPANAER